MIVYLQMIETDEDKSKFEEIYQEYRNLMYYVDYILSILFMLHSFVSHIVH